MVEETTPVIPATTRGANHEEHERENASTHGEKGTRLSPLRRHPNPAIGCREAPDSDTREPVNAPNLLETVVLCVDGSEVSTRAVACGFALLQPATRVVIVTVIDAEDPSLVTGSGFAGGVMSPEQYEELEKENAKEGWATVEGAAAELNLSNAELHVLRGAPGPALCSYAKDVAARAVVMGSRGRGGVKRALLGSVSDHVVRNAPCPVVVVGPEA